MYNSKSLRKHKANIKNKITNHLMQNGKKYASERIIIKGIKELQKASKKNHKEIIQLCILNSQPIFKIKTMKNKKTKKKSFKEIPFFLAEKSTGISTSIKYIFSDLKKDSHIKLKEEIIQNAKNQGKAVKIKNELQKKVLSNKRYLKTYRWNF